MIISKKNKALVLRLKDPNRVTSVIPGAKLFQYEGKDYVAVRHGIDETRVLRNLGFDAPSPILYHYVWPGRFKPFSAQRTTSAFMTFNPRAFNLSDMGTGKTLSTLWAYDYLRGVGKHQKLLVVGSLSTLERTWADEIFQHFSHLEFAVLHGTREKRLKLLGADVDVYIINHDGVKVPGLVEALADRPDITLVAIDELAQTARNAGTGRFKALDKICNKQHPREVWGLTGAPTPNSPTDAWAQCRLVQPGSVPPYFNRFRDSVMRQISQYTWIPRRDSAATVQEAMQPAIRFSRDECVDLPECVYQMRSVEMSPTQKTAYKEMFAKFRTEADSGMILAINEGVKSSKLLQIACGVAYDAKGEEHTFDATPRLSVVNEVVEEAGTKVIVYVPFVSAVGLVAEYLRSKGHVVDIIHGGIGKTQRDQTFHNFQREADPKVIVAQPAAMSHGLTLTSASTIVWYAALPNNEIFEQANARITRPGQKHSQLIVMIEGCEIERKAYVRLKERQRVQGLLLEAVREGREEVPA